MTKKRVLFVITEDVAFQLPTKSLILAFSTFKITPHHLCVEFCDLSGRIF